MGGFRVRLYGVLLAGLVAFVTVLLIQLLGADEVNQSSFEFWAVEGYCILAAGLAALLLSTVVAGGRGKGIRAIFAMAISTYLIGLFLFPIVLAAGSLPSVLNGGEIQCVSRGLSVCQSGLYGDAAWEALVQATVTYYAWSPVALVIGSPVMVLLLAPATAWVALLRRLVAHSSASDPSALRLDQASSGPTI